MRTGLYAPLLAACLCFAGCQQTTTPVGESATQTNPPAIEATVSQASGSTSSVTPLNSATSANAASVTAAGTAGVQAFVDPATGELREPTDAELAAANRSKSQAQAVTSAASTSVKITQLPNGLTEYDLGTRARVDETVCIQKDGSLGECTAAQQEALRKAAQKKAP